MPKPLPYFHNNMFIGHAVMMQKQATRIAVAKFVQPAARDLADQIEALATKLEHELRKGIIK